MLTKIKNTAINIYIKLEAFDNISFSVDFVVWV